MISRYTLMTIKRVLIVVSLMALVSVIAALLASPYRKERLAKLAQIPRCVEVCPDAGTPPCDTASLLAELEMYKNRALLCETKEALKIKNNQRR